MFAVAAIVSSRSTYLLLNRIHLFNLDNDMSKSSIEEIGINDLKAILARTHVVETAKIVEGEKGISWDGHMTVFKDKNGFQK